MENMAGQKPIVVWALNLSVVLLVALYVSRYLSKPIVKLSSAVARFASGDLSTQVDIKTTGEVQTLVEHVRYPNLNTRRP